VPLLNFIGALFVYKSPKPYQGFASFLRYLPNRKLRILAGTTSHLNKTRLIEMILEDTNRG
jgi:hypothetical protein